MNSRLTFFIVSKPMAPEEARKEYDYAKSQMMPFDEYSEVRGTFEIWNGQEWVVQDNFRQTR